jgi:hypothetical protein
MRGKGINYQRGERRGLTVVTADFDGSIYGAYTCVRT